MKLAILHFHLGRGGVTQVITNHLRGMASLPEGERPSEVVVLHGGRDEGWPAEPIERWAPGMAARTLAVPGLGYDSDEAGVDPDRLAAAIAGALARCGLEPREACLHVHNHSLGKNLSLPGALGRLAADGWPLVLQPHDFAEDYRPENLRRLIDGLGVQTPRDLDRILYPQADGIHYLTLTARDADNLASLGVPGARLHVLPNSVVPNADAPVEQLAQRRARVRRQLGIASEARWALYPVRGIRRKNLGEMLLWAAVADVPAAVAITLPPQTPVEAESYRRWRAVARSLELPAYFDVGVSEGLSLGDNLAAADFVLSTSVAEGFGMTLIETWLAGRMLAGRDLPGVTRDFRRIGIEFPLLEARLRIPLPEQDIAAIGRDVSAAYRQAIGHLPPAFARHLSDRPPAVTRGDAVDFGRLTSAWQIEILRRIGNGAIAPAEVRQANPVIRRAWHESLAGWEGVIESNARLVAQEFDITRLARRLVAIYQAAIRGSSPASPEPPPHPGRLLARLLDPVDFFPLRTEL